MMNNILKLIGRTDVLFGKDINDNNNALNEIVSSSRFLVVGAAGTIGQAVTKEIFNRNPRILHAVDISENNLVELVRDIRSSAGYIEGDFQTYALDSHSQEFSALVANNQYDYVLNLSALKHVRSEKDPFTLMRLIQTNIFNADELAGLAALMNSKKYFCVSTDKAANPVNMMGASKRIMEMFMMRQSEKVPVSMARFANVAFSDGSLLHGFNQRLMKMQPLSAPNDVKRYFVTPAESGELCLLSCLLGENRDIYFPKLSEELDLITFSDIAIRYLEQTGYEPVLCDTEDEARQRVRELAQLKKWPCYFFRSDTTGEKDYEEFFTDKEILDLEKFQKVGIIKNSLWCDNEKLEVFTDTIHEMKSKGIWTRENLVQLFHDMIPDFGHKETGKFLDSRM